MREQQWKEATLEFARLSEEERSKFLALMDVVSPGEAFTLRICLRLWFYCGACGGFQMPFEEDSARDVGERPCLFCRVKQHNSAKG